MLMHVLLWLPKLLYFVANRIAVWSGAAYCFRRAKQQKIYYFYGSLIYLTSWTILILFFRETLFSHLEFVLNLIGFGKKIS